MNVWVADSSKMLTWHNYLPKFFIHARFTNIQETFSKKQKVDRKFNRYSLVWFVFPNEKLRFFTFFSS